VKIPKPSKPEAPPFRRKRGPPPQATRLLVASLLAALVFMAALAIVFVPRYLENLNPPPTNLLHLNLTAGHPRIEVTFALYDWALSRFNATLARDNLAVATLPPGLSGTSAGLNFTDANQDGLLDVGDYFTLPSGPQGLYRFEIWQLDLDVRVGSVVWTGASP
jgi:hypothetical protein